MVKEQSSLWSKWQLAREEAELDVLDDEECHLASLRESWLFEKPAYA